MNTQTKPTIILENNQYYKFLRIDAPEQFCLTFTIKFSTTENRQKFINDLILFSTIPTRYLVFRGYRDKEELELTVSKLKSEKHAESNFVVSLVQIIKTIEVVEEIDPIKSSDIKISSEIDKRLIKQLKQKID